MKITHHNNHEKYFFYLLLLASLVLAFLVFKPFLIVIILSASFSVVFHPLFDWFLNNITKSKSFASFLTVFVFLLIVAAPLVGLGSVAYSQSTELFSSGSIYDSTTKAIYSVSSFLIPSGIELDIQKIVGDFVSSASKNITGFLSSILSVLFSFLLVIMAMFFFLKDGDVWRKFLLRLSPLKDSHDLKILNEIKMTINGVVKGYLLIALIQGFLVGVGLWIFGVSNFALWGAVAGVAALVPVVGTAIVVAPIIIYLFAEGQTTNATGLLIWSVLFVGLIDNLLHPIIVGKQVNIHPMVILFSVLGGLSLFGPTGLLIGPILISFLFVLGNIYLKNFENPTTSQDDTNLE